MHLKHLFEDIDKTVSIMLIILSLLFLFAVIFIVRKPLYMLIGIIMLFTGIIWLRIQKKAFIDFSSNYRYFLLLNIIFYVFLSFSLIALNLRSETYVRPLTYFLIISIMVGIISLEIFYTPLKKFNFHILFQIMIIGFSLSLSQLFLFPTVIGIDPWWHQQFTFLVNHAHQLPAGNYPYAKIPIFHLLIMNTSLITGLDYKMSSIFSVTLPLIVVCVFIIYNMGRYLVNDKVGLLGSLILVISNFFINGEIWVIPTTLGGIFLITILYLLLTRNDKNPITISFLAIFLMFVLVLTHTIVSMVMASILIMGWGAIIFYKYIYGKSKNNFSLTLASYFVIIMLGWWIYASGTIINVVRLIKWGLEVDPSLSATPEVILNYISSISLDQQIIFYFGIFLLFSFAAIGIFFLISKKNRNDRKFIFAIVSATPLFISFVSFIFGKSIIEGRWLFISEILLALPVAIAIITLSQYYGKRFKSQLLFGFVIALSFLMILNHNVANVDNNILYPDGSVRYALTNSELAAFETVSNFDLPIKADDYYLYANSSLTLSPEIRRRYSLSNALYNKNLNGTNNTIVLIRKEVVEHPSVFYGTIYMLNYNLTELFVSRNFSIVYDSQSVKGYIQL